MSPTQHLTPRELRILKRAEELQNAKRGRFWFFLFGGIMGSFAFILGCITENDRAVLSGMLVILVFLALYYAVKIQIELYGIIQKYQGQESQLKGE